MKSTKSRVLLSPIYSTQRRPGPEQGLEDLVVSQIHNVMPLIGNPTCIYGSRPIGAGAPDLVLLYLQPNVRAPLHEIDAVADVLAYLRVVRRAYARTLSTRLRLGEDIVECCLRQLTTIGALDQSGSTYALAKKYRSPFKEVIAIETKVDKWKDAVSQAARNRTFSNRSFVALPESQARLALSDPRVAMFGIGVLSISAGTVKLVRRSRRSLPRVWRYYFDLFLASTRNRDRAYAVRGPNRRGAKTPSSVQVRRRSDAE